MDILPNQLLCCYEVRLKQTWIVTLQLLQQMQILVRCTTIQAKSDLAISTFNSTILNVYEQNVTI